MVGDGGRCESTRACTQVPSRRPMGPATPTARLEHRIKRGGRHPVGGQRVEQAGQQRPRVRQAVRIGGVVRLCRRGGSVGVSVGRGWADTVLITRPSRSCVCAPAPPTPHLQPAAPTPPNLHDGGVEEEVALLPPHKLVRRLALHLRHRGGEGRGPWGGRGQPLGRGTPPKADAPAGLRGAPSALSLHARPARARLPPNAHLPCRCLRRCGCGSPAAGGRHPQPPPP